MAEESPDDCAIKVSWVLGKKPFVLDRLPSNGPFSKDITFYPNDGTMEINYRGKEPRQFTISFRLPEEDESGGFAGIKAWPEEGREPEGFWLTGEIPNTPFNVQYETNKDKVTLLRIDDRLRERAAYHYCLGLFQTNDRNVHNIVPDDPRIYNNWTPPWGRSGCLQAWKGIFLSKHRRRRFSE